MFAFAPRAVAAVLLVAGAAHAAPSTRFQVSGAVSQPSSFDLTALAALPSAEQTVSFSAAGVTQTHDYTGASLWGVLNSAGIVVGTAKNDILNRDVLATGSDGYQTVFSLGELDPSFGNRPDLVAYDETIAGVKAPLTGDGFARITAPGDAKGGRYVSNLVGLSVQASGSQAIGTGGGASTSFSVSGTVATPTRFTLASLKNLPVTTETVAGHTYTGVSFWDLLNTDVGLGLDPAVKNDVLSKYVVATGSDGYKVVFSLGELSTDFGAQPDLIAYAVDGVPLATDGFARVIVPNDVKAGRWVSNLVSLEVLSAAPVPEPAGWALLLVGLAATARQAASGVKRSARPFMQ